MKRKFFTMWDPMTSKVEDSFRETMTEQIGYRENSDIVNSFLVAGQNLYDYRYGAANGGSLTYDYDETFDGDDWKAPEEFNITRAKGFDEIDAKHLIRKGEEVLKEVKAKTSNKKKK